MARNLNVINKEFIIERIVPDLITGCWNWVGAKTGDGYGMARENYEYIIISRRAYELWVGPIPDKMQALHRCDNPGCCHPCHLFAGTHQDNMTDKAIKGRATAFNRNLSFEQAESVKADPRKNAEIAKEYGVHTNCVRLIKCGKTYRRDIRCC